MGIVVTVCMLLALVVFLPAINRHMQSIVKMLIGLLVLLIGSWNVLYGVQHWQVFWGLAAWVSGLVMIMAAMIIIGRESSHPIMTKIYVVLQPLSVLVTVSLLCCFLLYAITLVQLNLGYPIIR